MPYPDGGKVIFSHMCEQSKRETKRRQTKPLVKKNLS